MLGRRLYSLALRAATPALFARLLWRSRRAPDYRRRWGERLGYGPPVPGRPVWIHAVSVGETIAAAGLVESLIEHEPERPVLVTSTTPTGSERVRALFGARVYHCYLPYDTPGAVRRFLARTAPAAGVLLETEIWPNLLAAARRDGVPMVLANARLSARSAAGYARVPQLTREALAGLAVIAAQHDDDARRFVDLGAPAERVQVTGSLKFDQQVPAAQREAGRALRARLGERPVWVAASTHEGEEEAALRAHVEVRRYHAAAALILVPRHPERFASVAAQVQAHGFTMTRRSDGEAAEHGNTAVILGDTMGELPALLAAGDVAFMGGSLVRVGGHNPLEPAALGVPVLTGPYTHNFSHIVELLRDADAARVIHDSGALAAAVCDWLDDESSRQQAADAGEAVIAAHRGALQRLTRQISAVMAR